MPSGFDVVVLTVKAYAVATALADLRPLVGNTGLILAAQNGVGSDPLLLDAFGADRVVALTTTSSLDMPAPGVVRCHNSSGGLAFSYFNPPAVPLDLPSLFAGTRTHLREVPRPDSLRWSKLALNSVAAALCAILDADPAEIASHPRLLEIERLALQETRAVLKAAGIRPVDLPGYPVRALLALARLPAPLFRTAVGRSIRQGRGSRSPGLRRDVQAGGPSEIDYLNGAVVRMGREVGVGTPINECLYDLVRSVETSPDDRERLAGRATLLASTVLDRRPSSRPAVRAT